MPSVHDGTTHLLGRLGANIVEVQPDGAVDFELSTGLAGFATSSDVNGNVRVSFVIALDSSPSDVATWLATASTDGTGAKLEAVPDGSVASIRLLVVLRLDSPEEQCWQIAREAVRLQADWREYMTDANPPDVDAVREALIRLVYPLGAAPRDVSSDLLLDDAIRQMQICVSQWQAVVDSGGHTAATARAQGWTEALRLMSLFLHGVRHGGF